MKLTSYLPAFVTFAVAAAIAVFAASFAVTQIERRSVEDVNSALRLQGHDWVDVTADGLQLALMGTAPDEATRFRALSVAGSIVDSSRVLDEMEVVESTPIAPPRFSIEMLRGDDGISLIGLIPASTDRAAVVERIAEFAPDTQITDLLELASYPAPANWDKAVGFGLSALKELPRSKVSVGSDKVTVLSMAESRADKTRLEGLLTRATPEGLTVALNISAPRPVITPFTLRFLIDEKGARFDACSAATPEGRKTILAAARTAGLEGDEDCTIGLGVPSPDWPRAAATSILALADLGGGSVTFSDADITLVAPEGTAQDVFDREVGELEGALPDSFSLHAVLPEPPEQEARPEGPAEFTATRSAEGKVQLRGRVGDARARKTVESFAKSLFGINQVTDATRSDDNLAPDWSPRLLAALDGLSLLTNGLVVVRPDLVEISGMTGHKDAKAEIARILSDQLGEKANFRIDVRYDEDLDPVLGLPTPEECVADINQVLKTRKITFAPGSATIDTDARETVDKIAELLRTCDDVQMEIAGFTDSQGRETMNQQLSQSRAEAVLTALAARRVLTSNLTAKGYGEENPIADNGTEEGREANRRIEFTLIVTEEDHAADDGHDHGEAAEGETGEPAADEAGATGDGSGDEGSGDGADEAETTDGAETGE